MFKTNVASSYTEVIQSITGIAHCNNTSLEEHQNKSSDNVDKYKNDIIEQPNRKCDMASTFSQIPEFAILKTSLIHV